MKTTWQKFYSFFGFWQYIHHIGNDKAYLITYWCCFPFFFIRKFDVWRTDVSKTHSVNAEKEDLRRKIIAKGESPEKDYPWIFAR